MKTNKLNLFSSILFALCFSVTGLSQSGGCVNFANVRILDIANSCVTTAFTVAADGTDAFEASCAAGGTSYRHGWYIVTGTGNNITITVDNANRNLVLSAFENCAALELACTNIPSGNTGSITFPSNLGSSYFISIQRRSGSSTDDLTGDICATSTMPAVNDTPCSAYALGDIFAGCEILLNDSNLANAQASSSNGGSPSCTTLGKDVWFSFEAPASGDVTITGIEVDNGNAITDGVMELYSGPCTSLTSVECNDDDGADNMPSITRTDLIPGDTYFIRFWEFGGGNDGYFGLCVSEPNPNETCSNPSPICSGSNTSFLTTVSGQDAEDDLNTGNDYGCLSSSPDPTWYYLEISVAGDLELNLNGSDDVDYAIWGPFADLATAQADCDSYGAPEDCSYSSSNNEIINVTGVLAGEVYALVVTNYAAEVQAVTLGEGTNNTASTDCAILGVNWKDFNGYNIKDKNQINWSTYSERNNDYFIVEKSIDNKYWTLVDLIKGNGTTNTESHYQTSDNDVYQDISYYRIKQFDQNGLMTISKIISVSRMGMNEVDLEIYPNPSNDAIKVSSSFEFSRIQIKNVNGHLIEDKLIQPDKNKTVDISTLPKGIYFCTIYSNKDGIKTKKFVKN